MAPAAGAEPSDLIMAQMHASTGAAPLPDPGTASFISRGTEEMRGAVTASLIARSPDLKNLLDRNAG